MNFLERLWKKLSPIEGAGEDLLVDFWRSMIKKQTEPDRFIDVVAVGKAEDKTLYAKGFCPVVVGPHLNRQAVVLRSMVQSKLVTEKGPMPVILTHKLVLLPLPSFYVRNSMKEIREFIADWEGKTEAFGIPFCFYTTIR